MSTLVQHPAAHTLGDVLDHIEEVARAARLGDRTVTLGEIMATIGRRGYGPILLLVGLVSISPLTLAPGTTSIAATVTLILSLQLAAGAPHPWLPRGALALEVPVAALHRWARRLRPWAERLDALLQPRFVFLAESPFINIGALMCIGSALMTYPLSLIPAAPLAPGIAITLFGLGVTARDGMLLGLSGLCVCAAGGLAVYLAFLTF
jgi:hypothetical protein